MKIFLVNSYKATKHYKPTLDKKGAEKVFQELKAILETRYHENPAVIMSRTGKKIILPLHWGDFEQLTRKLNATEKQDALKAYHQHTDHTALRYFLEPNPWLDPKADFRDRENHCSNYKKFKEEILIRWLAASDPKIGTFNGYTTPDRIDLFIKEISFLGRAHNWDLYREKRVYNGDEYTFCPLTSLNAVFPAPQSLYLAIKDGHLVYRVVDLQGKLTPLVYTTLAMTSEDLAAVLDTTELTFLKTQILNITTDNNHTQGTPVYHEKNGVMVPEKEQYDNKKADAPTCNPGATGRLTLANLGHPLFISLTPELLEQTIKEYVNDYFRVLLQNKDCRKIETAMDNIVQLNDEDESSTKFIQTLDLPQAAIEQLMSQLAAQYKEDFNDRFKEMVSKRFERTMTHAAHAFAFSETFQAALDKALQNTPTPSQPPSPVSFIHSGSSSPRRDASGSPTPLHTPRGSSPSSDR